MKFRATLKTHSLDAESVSAALDVDNTKQESLAIKTSTQGDLIVTDVESNNLGTLANTLDDLLACQMSAEKLMHKK